MTEKFIYRKGSSVLLLTGCSDLLSTVVARPIAITCLVVLMLALPGRPQARQAARPTVHLAPTPHIYVISHDTATSPLLLLSSPKRSWVQQLPMFFALGTPIVDLSENKCENEADCRRNLLDKLVPGDYVLIALDSRIGPRAISPPVAALRKLIKEVKEKAGIPVVVLSAGQSNQSAGIDQLVSGGAVRVIHFPVERDYFIGPGLSVYGSIRIAKEIATQLQAAFPELAALKSGQALAGAGLAGTHYGQTVSTTIPAVADPVADALKLEADIRFKTLPLRVNNAAAGSLWRSRLRAHLMQLCGVKIFHQLDLDIHETGLIAGKGYKIHKIYFQTRPGVYASANLYVPEGNGPFPAVINMHGHWPGGKAGDMVQAVAITLAKNGYVCLNIDAWGAGERTTLQDQPEYHGAGLGASLMNVGETLLGMQVTDNMRGVDLLVSLPNVDSARIGATGASGGGNQTMWLAALDTRIKACMPVVSVGTFQSYIMGSNCVCELMPGGLTCTEESGVLALIAPRSIQICNGLLDPSPTFAPAQMLRSYWSAKKAFAEAGAPDNIRYQLLNTPHGYFPETRALLLGWFDQKLKRDGAGSRDPNEDGAAMWTAEKAFSLLPAGQLLVFNEGQRPAEIATTRSFVTRRTKMLEAALSQLKKVDKHKKRSALRKILLLPDTGQPDRLVKNIESGKVAAVRGETNNASWITGQLQTKNGHLIGYRYLAPTRAGARILVVCPPDSAGKRPDGKFSEAYSEHYFKRLIDRYQQAGDGVFVATLWDLGTEGSVMGRRVNGTLPLFHTEARAALWLGHTVIGEWVGDLKVVSDFLTGQPQTQIYGHGDAEMQKPELDLAAGKELTVAGLAAAALYQCFDQLYVYQMPLAYRFKDAVEANFYNMAIFLPHYLNWGGTPMLAGLLNNTKVHFYQPLTLGGEALSAAQKKEFLQLYHHLSAIMGTENTLLFN